MRVVIAADCFTGTLSAVEAADALAAGWRDRAPAVDLDVVPMSDGGPGFVEVLATSLAGRLDGHVVSGPRGAVVTARVLVVGDTTYVESAHAAGLDLLAAPDRDPLVTTTYGVGELLAAVTAAGAARVVVGLGGSATNDGGAGMWAALGADPAEVLRGGGGGLGGLSSVEPPPVALPEIVLASDVDSPLLGHHGASLVFAPQKGAGAGDVARLEDSLRHWADLVEPAVGRPRLRDAPGAGAAGGLGFGLLALGASRVSGVGLVADAVGLAERLAAADLVVTGEGGFDSQSLRGKVVAGVARLAQRAGIPCVVVAGTSSVGRREAAAAGVDDVVTVADVEGSAVAAAAAGAAGLRRAAARAAAAWAPRA